MKGREPNDADGPLRGLLARYPVPGWRKAAWPIMALIAVAAAWSWFARLDEVAVATGEVIPQSNVKTIQHLEGGIVEAIHVREGQPVDAGEPLVALDLGSTGMNPDELAVRLGGLLLKRARLEAQAYGRELAFPAEQAARLPEVVEKERETHAARLAELESAVSVLREQLTQRGQEIRKLSERRRGLTEELKFARAQLANSEDLYRDQLISEMEHLEYQREVARLTHEIEETGAAIAAARSAQEEARQRIAETNGKVRREALEELSQVEVRIAQTRELLDPAERQRQRQVIRAPIDGVVKNLRHHTIGGVVRPGEPIMEVVPTQDNHVVEARLHPIDRGYVRVGQPATVKVGSYDFIRYGSLPGTVRVIAPDANTTEDGRAYYRVIVETAKTHLGSEDGQLPIMPGMQATVDIHTGERSVAEYLLRPVLKLKHEAFRER